MEEKAKNMYKTVGRDDPNVYQSYLYVENNNKRKTM